MPKKSKKKTKSKGKNTSTAKVRGATDTPQKAFSNLREAHTNKKFAKESVLHKLGTKLVTAAKKPRGVTSKSAKKPSDLAATSGQSTKVHPSLYTTKGGATVTNKAPKKSPTERSVGQQNRAKKKVSTTRKKR